MNKLKSIGISALAGTLVSLSAAQAGGVSVTGSWELSYTQLDHEKVTGNPLGMKKNISFGTGGDISDGGAVTWATTIGGSDAMGLSSASMSINMGGIATLAYDSGTGGYGANAVDNVVPTAWEEIDYGFATGISDVGAVSASKGVVNLTVKAPVAGTGFSLSYVNNVGGGHVADGGVSGGTDTGHKGVDLVIDFVDYNAKHAGFRWGAAAQMEFPEQTCRRTEKDLQVDKGWQELHSCNATHKDNPYAGTMYMKLALGPLHLGTQATFKNPQLASASAVMNQRTVLTGAALVFGDTLSLSYGIGYDRYRYNDRNRGFLQGDRIPLDTANKYTAQGADMGHEVLGPEDNEYVTQKYRGWSAAINLGPVALKGTRNRVQGDGSTSIYALDTTHSELNLSIAF